MVVLLSGRFSPARLTGGGADSSIDRVGIAFSLALIVLIIRSTERNRRLPRCVRGFLLVVSVLFAYLALSSLWAPRGAASASAILDLSLVPFFAFVGADLILRSPRENVKRFFFWLLLASVAYLLAGVAGIGRVDVTRLSAFYGGPNVFVRVMAIGILAALYLAVTTGRDVWFLPAPFLAIGAALSGSRGGSFALLVVGVSTAWWERRRLSARSLRRVFSLGAISGVLAFVMLRHAIFDYLYERYVELTFRGRYTSGRTELFDTAIRLFRAHPLTGAGVGGFAAASPSADNPYPHNLFLELAAEGGLVALAMVIVCFGVAIHQIRRSGRGPYAIEIHFCVLAATYHVVASQFSGDYLDSRFVWVFFAIAVGLSQPVSKFERGTPPLRSQGVGRAARTRQLPETPAHTRPKR